MNGAWVLIHRSEQTLYALFDSEKAARSELLRAPHWLHDDLDVEFWQFEKKPMDWRNLA